MSLLVYMYSVLTHRPSSDVLASRVAQTGLLLFTWFVQLKLNPHAYSTYLEEHSSDVNATLDQLVNGLRQFQEGVARMH
jgi:hypothetical protein